MKMFISHKIILLIILIPFSLLGQIKKNDLTKLEYTELSKLFFDIKNKSNQIIYAQAYLKKAEHDKQSILKARAYYMFSLMNVKEKAISYLDSVIKYSKNQNDPFFPISAFCEKSIIYRKQYKFKEAMDNYLIAEKYSLGSNEDDYYMVKYYIGILKSEDLGEVDEALKMYYQCYSYYKKKDIKDPFYSDSYQRTLFNISDAHKALNQLDSSSFYNHLGYNEAKTTKNERLQYLFILNEGANQVVKKNYNQAIDSINKALPSMIKYDNKMNVLASYYYLAKANAGLGKKDIAVKNFIKVDSIYEKLNYITPEFVEGYPFLINYYKSKSDKDKQLLYLNKFSKIDSLLQKNYKKMYKLIKEKYEIPHLIKDKESMISSLKSEKKYFYLAFLILALTLCSFAYYNYNLKKKHKLRFDKIVNKYKEYNIEIEKSNKKDIKITNVLMSNIVSKLKEFEKSKGFLNSKVTGQSLSQEFETNNKYLSLVINEMENKTFIQYINDLRIDYAILCLQSDNKLRKYTINALANEFGFNNGESFSIAFNKKTGIKPSYFIKQLENKQNT